MRALLFILLLLPSVVKAQTVILVLEDYTRTNQEGGIIGHFVNETLTIDAWCVEPDQFVSKGKAYTFEIERAPEFDWLGGWVYYEGENNKEKTQALFWGQADEETIAEASKYPSGIAYRLQSDTAQDFVWVEFKPVTKTVPTLSFAGIALLVLFMAGVVRRYAT